MGRAWARVGKVGQVLAGSRMFQPGKKLRVPTGLSGRFGGLRALASWHFSHPGSGTMAVLLAFGLFVSLAAASCQWPGMSRAVVGPGEAMVRGVVWVGREPTIRVRIVEPKAEVVVSGPRLVMARDGTGAVRVYRTPLVARAAGAGLELAEPGGMKTRVAGTVELSSGDPRPGGFHTPGSFEWYRDAPTVTVGGSAYAGVVRLEVADGGVQAVNALELERYVAAVASRELYPSWEASAYEAQAIAARSYAMQSMGLSAARGRGWHVESGTIDQAYPGHTTHERSIRAVMATRGRVLASGGRVLRAYYSSTSGGRSGSAADTWPTSAGFEYNLAVPLQAHTAVHASDASRYHTWQVVRSADDVTRRLRAWGAANGHTLRSARSVAAIEVERTNRVGRPAVFRVGESNGVSHTLSAEQLRVALNTSAAGLPDVTGDTRVRSGDLEVTATGQRVVIRGRGFGHGVGMCQFSAQALALRGWSAEAILMNFYPGARIERAY